MPGDFQSLKVEGLTISFGGVDVVSGVDFELKPGEIHALTGENGAGKSSLAKAIAGVYRSSGGKILLNGQEVRFRNPREAMASGVALIHQEPLSFPDLDVAENIFAGHQPGVAGFVSKRQAQETGRKILKELGFDLDVRKLVGGLSVAQRQIVELACAMSHRASVWILDETTAPLTPKETAELFEVVKRLRDSGCGIVIVTHRLEEVFAHSDRITVLRDGKKITEKATAETSPAEIVRLMVGRELASERLLATSPPGEVFLETRSLSGPGFWGVSLTAKRGEVIGVAGLVGAGRTELARVLFGMAKASAGEILVKGQQVSIRSPREAKRLGIALVPEDRQHEGLLMPQSVTFNATLAQLGKFAPGGWIRPAALGKASTSYAEKLKLAYRSGEQPVGQLSGGNQQKVVLSKWLMTAPQMLILDEPTRGVDVGAKHEVHKAIRAQADAGMAVLMISSDLLEILSVSDRVLVMRGGQMVAEFGAGPTEEQVMAAATGAVA
jgi:rhamnose transport system ATP-binding protein